MNAFVKLFAVSTLFAALVTSVHAEERVFLLQLGSYESRAEAQSRYSSLRETYPDLFEGLSLRLLDVTLPPDNFTVYRTQAGALSSRADAQIICEKLMARGDECYVVETAMFNPQEMQQPAPLAAAAPAAAIPAAQPVTQPTFSNAPQEASLNAEMQAMEADLAQQSAQPLSLAAPEVSPNLALPVGAGLSPSVASALPSPELAPALAPTEPKRSFWSRLNPFSSDEEEAVAEAALPADNELAMSADPFAAVPPEPALTAQQPSIAAPSPEALRLPPPPLSAASISAQRAEAPPVAPAPPLITPQGTMVPVAPASAAPPPIMAESLPSNLPFDVKTRDGQKVNLPQAQPITDVPAPSYIAAGDEVRVSEAVPVPVTNDVAMPSAPEPYTAQQLRALGMPSQPAIAGRNLWAEIKFFDTQQAALAFWNEFRSLNRDFPPARVRLTNSYVTSTTQRARVALRVGPFEHDAAVSTICAQVRGEEAHCQAVRELGNSIAASRDPAANARIRPVPQSRSARGTH